MIGGGLPKARIIKFMNFNGGICSPYSFRPPGGGVVVSYPDPNIRKCYRLQYNTTYSGSGR